MWEEKEGKLCKTFIFKDFNEAWEFMSKVAQVIIKVDHHPKWSNVWNKVSFELKTFEGSKTITEKDFELSKAIDKIASTYL
jgi:4a-hydroxytetrahydrobiopterin dehydratase